MQKTTLSQEALLIMYPIYNPYKMYQLNYEILQSLSFKL